MHQNIFKSSRNVLMVTVMARPNSLQFLQHSSDLVFSTDSFFLILVFEENFCQNYCNILLIIIQYNI